MDNPLTIKYKGNRYYFLMKSLKLKYGVEVVNPFIYSDYCNKKQSGDNESYSY